MPRFSNRPFLATTLSFLSSRGAADSLRRVGREMTKLVPSAAAKGAPGLAFETWDPSNQFPLETPILLFVIPTGAEGPAVPQTPRGDVFRQSVPGFPATQHRTGPRVRSAVSFRLSRRLFSPRGSFLAAYERAKP